MPYYNGEKWAWYVFSSLDFVDHKFQCIIAWPILYIC